MKQHTFKHILKYILVNLFCIMILAGINALFMVKGLLPQKWITISSVCIVFISCVLSCKMTGCRAGKNTIREVVIRILVTVLLYGTIHLIFLREESLKHPEILAGIVCGILLGFTKQKKRMVRNYL